MYILNSFLAVPSPPTDVRLTSIVNNSEIASVTIEWDPPSQGGSPLSYIVRTIPDLISGHPPVNTSTNTTITINYNTNYIITITASNCLGNGFTSDVLSVNIGKYVESDIIIIKYLYSVVNCSDPSPVAGVTFSPFSDTL